MSWSGGSVVHSVVVEVAAGCREGSVTWRYPHHSALRVSFTPPPPRPVSSHYHDHHHHQRDDDDAVYEVCCVVSAAYCDVRLSLDTAAAGSDAKDLVVGVLNSSWSSSSSEPWCFQTAPGRGPVALYAQLLQSPRAGRDLSRAVGSLVIDYDIRRITSSRHVTGQFYQRVSNNKDHSNLARGGMAVASPPNYSLVFAIR